MVLRPAGTKDASVVCRHFDSRNVREIDFSKIDLLVSFCSSLIDEVAGADFNY